MVATYLGYGNFLTCVNLHLHFHLILDFCAVFPRVLHPDLLLVEEGTHTGAEMFQTAQSANTVMTWILRLVGFIVMFIGLGLIFRPFSVAGDVVPFIGNLLGVGIGFFAFVTSFVLTIITIAIAWIAVRPILGISLLVLAAGGLFWLISANRKKKRALQAQPGAAQPA